jgi:PAS domain S-box-containing protein
MKVVSKLRRYSLAIISCGLALAVAWPLDAPSSCFFLAVMASGLYGGKGPALLSFGLSALAFDYFFVSPRFQLSVEPSSYLRFAVFLGATLLIVGLVETKRRVEESRREINAQYRTISDTAPDAIISIDCNAWILFVNPAATRIFGWDASEMIGQPLTILLPKFQLAERLSGGESIGRRKDGTEFPAELSFGAVSGSDPRSFTGFVRDISKRKRAQAALQKSESYLAEAQRLGHAGSWAVGLDRFEPIYWSAEMFRIFGLPPADHPPSSEERRKFFAPEVLARFLQVLETARRNKIYCDDEFPFILPDGSNRMVRIVGRPVLNEAGDVVEFIGTTIDVTEQHQARAALQEAFDEIKKSEDKIRLIIDTVPALLWTARPEGVIDFVSQRWLDYAGMTLEEKLRLDWGAQCHPDDIDQAVTKWRAALAEGQPFETETRLRSFDGEYRWFLSRAFPLFDRSGYILGWYGNDLDIHDRKQAEEALRRTQERLSHATHIATVGELAAAIAHEVNQPLSAVVANAHACLRWLLADPPNLAKAHEAATRIVRDGKDAGEVVRRVRALFKRTTGEKIALDLNEVIGEVLRLLHGDAARRRVIVETDLDRNLPSVVGDRVQLQQLLLNLVRNGFEAMDPVVDRPKRLFIQSARESVDAVLVEIRDHGVGMEDPEKAFEAFFTTKENGMGMGLAICRSIIEAHHGRLWAESGEGPGATVRFIIPLQSNGAQ